MQNQYEDRLRIYIESEIVNYNYHKTLISRYQSARRKAYADMGILPTSSTGSVIKMPEKNYNSQEARNKQIGLYIDELDEKIKSEQIRVDCVDTWLRECCNTEKQRNVIKVYMIKYMSKDIKEAANELCCSIENIIKIRRRFINRIIVKYF